MEAKFSNFRMLLEPDNKNLSESEQLSKKEKGFEPSQGVYDIVLSLVFYFSIYIKSVQIQFTWIEHKIQICSLWSLLLLGPNNRLECDKLLAMRNSNDLELEKTSYFRLS